MRIFFNKLLDAATSFGLFALFMLVVGGFLPAIPTVPLLVLPATLHAKFLYERFKHEQTFQ